MARIGARFASSRAAGVGLAAAMVAAVAVFLSAASPGGDRTPETASDIAPPEQAVRDIAPETEPDRTAAAEAPGTVEPALPRGVLEIRTDGGAYAVSFERGVVFQDM